LFLVGAALRLMGIWSTFTVTFTGTQAETRESITLVMCRPGGQSAGNGKLQNELA
jgi:hypothetical protein